MGPLKGELKGGEFVVGDGAEELHEKGYGELKEGVLRLLGYEAIYLAYTGRVEFFKGRRLGFSELVREATKLDPNAWTKFIVYRDLRDRGYVVKDGFGIGVDLRVYERGEYGKKPAKYLIFVLREGERMGSAELSEAVERIIRLGKIPLVAVVERRGEVIYYRLGRMRF